MYKLTNAMILPSKSHDDVELAPLSPPAVGGPALLCHNLGKLELPRSLQNPATAEPSEVGLTNIAADHEKTIMSSPLTSVGPAAPANRRFDRLSKRGVGSSSGFLDIQLITGIEAQKWNIYPSWNGRTNPQTNNASKFSELRWPFRAEFRR